MSFSSTKLCENINYVMLSGSKTPVVFYRACKATAWSKTGKGKKRKVKPELDSGGDLIHRCINYTDIKCLVCKILHILQCLYELNR